MSSRREEQLLVAQRAAEWLERLPTATPQERAECTAWIKESPLHVRELLAMMELNAQLASGTLDRDRRIDVDAYIAQAANVVSLPARSAIAAPSGRGRTGRRFRYWLAAAAVTLLAAGLWWWLPGIQTVEHSYATTIGEQRAVELEDGSSVHLNARSAVRVRLSGSSRDLYLTEGQALFSVEHDPTRPFRVHVGDAIVQAVGTQFDIDRRADRTTVAVLEGVVQIRTEARADVSADQDPLRLAAGEGTSIENDGRIAPPRSIDAAEVKAWQQRRLIFHSATLAEIADEFGRFNRTPRIRVEGMQARTQRYTAVFDADNPAALLRYLAKDDTLELYRQETEIIIRPRSSELSPAR